MLALAIVFAGATGTHYRLDNARPIAVGRQVVNCGGAAAAPRWLAVDAKQRRLFVYDATGGTVFRMDAIDAPQRTCTAVGRWSGVRGLAYDENANRLLAIVGDPSPHVVSVDPLTGSAQPVAIAPEGGAVTAIAANRGNLYFLRANDPSVYARDASGAMHALGTIPLTHSGYSVPGRLAVAPDPKFGFVAFVLDFGQNSIFRMTPDGAVSLVVQSPLHGDPHDALFYRGTSLCVESANGNAVLASEDGLLLFDARGELIRVFSVPAWLQYPDDDELAAAGPKPGPVDVACDAATGAIYATDGSRVVQFQAESAKPETP